jgi:hypothetical protein
LLDFGAPVAAPVAQKIETNETEDWGNWGTFEDAPV